MKINVFADADSVAREAALFIAALATEAVAVRGRFITAVSGGVSPRLMLSILAREDLPWRHVQIAQVDERIAPAQSPERNLFHLRECLRGSPLRPEQVHAMPVESTDLEAAAKSYALTLQQIAGFPPTFDLVTLGLGSDGHTASLLPGDPVLDVTDADVALAGVSEGLHRMTLTVPILNRARRLLWLVTGSEKAGMLARLNKADESIPASLIAQDNAVVFADRAAAQELKDVLVTS